MLDGFNAGWIEFEGGQAGSRKGTTTLHTALEGLVALAADSGVRDAIAAETNSRP